MRLNRARYVSHRARRSPIEVLSKSFQSRESPETFITVTEIVENEMMISGRAEKKKNIDNNRYCS